MNQDDEYVDFFYMTKLVLDKAIERKKIVIKKVHIFMVTRLRFWSTDLPTFLN